MLTLSIALLVASSSTTVAAPRETKLSRAARLMTADERAQLDAFSLRLDELGRPAGNVTLLASSVVTLSVGVLVPVVLAVPALGYTIIGGFFGLLVALGGSTAILETIPVVWAAIFSIVPVWGWVAIAAVTIVGAGMLTGALLADGPRQAQLRAVRRERNQLVDSVLSRPSPPPLTTVFTF